MDRAQLEHVIRAASSVADDPDIVVVGSQSILASFPDAPEALLRSIEADVFPRNAPERAIVIDGAIGEGSPFHETFGYFAHGVGPETSVVAPGWEDRLVRIQNDNTRGASGWCLEPHDSVLAKLVAGREHDVAFAAEAIGADLVTVAELHVRLAQLAVDEPRRLHTAELLRLVAARAGH